MLILHLSCIELVGCIKLCKKKKNYAIYSFHVFSCFFWHSNIKYHNLQVVLIKIGQSKCKIDFERCKDLACERAILRVYVKLTLKHAVLSTKHRFRYILYVYKYTNI